MPPRLGSFDAELVVARQLRILARQHRPVLAPGMTLIDKGQRALVGPLPWIFAVQSLPSHAVRPGGLHVGVAYLAEEIRQVRAAESAAEDLPDGARETRADAQADQLAIIGGDVGAHRPGRSHGLRGYVANLIVVVDDDAERKMMDQFAGRHVRPRFKGYRLSFLVGDTGLDLP